MYGYIGVITSKLATRNLTASIKKRSYSYNIQMSQNFDYPRILSWDVLLKQKMNLSLSQYFREAYGSRRKKRTSPDCLKIRRNCIKTLEFSISIYIIMFHSYINAFISKWYVSNTYHSPVNVHVKSRYYIRGTPVFWSRLGRNCYGTDTYLPSSYSRSEYLFRTRFLATDLVTSLEIQPIYYPFMLCHFRQTRNGYVATYFILLSSTAASSATSGYVVVPEHVGQNEEPACINDERTRKKPTFASKVNLIDSIVIKIFYEQFSILPIFCAFSNTFLLWKIFWIFCLCYYSLCRCGIKHFDVNFPLIRPIYFRRKMEKTRSVKKEMDGKVFMPARLGIFPL